MRSLLLLCLFFAGCGGAAGWLVGGLLPPTPAADDLQTWTADYRLERKQGDPFVVSDGKWLRVLRLVPDFDLHMDVELGADMDLDLLVRQVEPRLLHGQIVPFSERFVALRLTTGKDGPAWRTREQALFGERGTGASLAPGYPATVWVQGRGRLLRANVAGRWTPWFEAEDTEGMFTVLARGGTATLQRLVIENRGNADAWLQWRVTWLVLGAFGGLLVAAVAVGCGRPPLWPLLLLGGWVVGSVAWRVSQAPLAPLRMPPPSAQLALLAAPMLLAAGALFARSLRGHVARFAALGAALAVHLLANEVAEAQLRSDTQVVDAVFGRDAGNSLSEALGLIVRGPFGLHAPDAAGPRVFLLGGQLLYGRLGPATENLEPLVGGELRGRLRKPVDVVALPTLDGHARQQWAMFSQLFADAWRPAVIVFGVPRDEAAIDPATGEPRSSPSTLADTLRAAREHARAHGAALVLFTEAGLPADLLDVLRTAERDGLPLVVAADGEPAAAVAKRLAAAVQPLLP